MSDGLVTGWKQISLRQIASPIRRPVTVQSNEYYRTMGVRWWGEGAYERESKYGHEIKAGKLYRVAANDLVINRIWVRHGSSGIIDDALDGCVVTQDFPTFELDLQQVTTAWLRYMFRAKWFWQECDRKSRGTSGRQRINPDEYLDIEIPLPPLAEQRRIVVKLDALAARVEQALALQTLALQLRDHWFMASLDRIFSRLSTSYRSTPLKELFSFRQELIRPKNSLRENLRFVGLQHVEPHTGRKIGEDWIPANELTGRKFRFSPGNIVYGYLRPYLNKVWIADCEGICSVDQYVLVPDSSQVRTEYLAYAMRSPLFLKQSELLTGVLMLPRLRTGLLEQIQTPLPSLADQDAIIEHLRKLYAKMYDLRSLQGLSKAELEALLPSALDRAFRGEL